MNENIRINGTIDRSTVADNARCFAIQVEFCVIIKIIYCNVL